MTLMLQDQSPQELRHWSCSSTETPRGTLREGPNELSFRGRGMGYFDELVYVHELSPLRFAQLQADVRVEEEVTCV